MHVLDRDQQRLAPRARLDELRDHPFLAARARRRVERLVEGSIVLALRNLEQVAQVRRIVVRLSIRGCGDDRPVDVPQRGVPREAEQARDDCADGSMTPLRPEVEHPAHVAREAEIGGDRLNFLDESGFADSRLPAHDDDGPRRSVLDGGQGGATLREFGPSPDKDRTARCRTPQSRESPRLDRTFQALQALAAEGFVIRGMACRVVDLRRHERLAGDRPIRKPRGDIGRASRHRIAAVPVAADGARDDLPHRNADMHRKGARVDREHCRDRSLNFERGANCAQSVVPMSAWGAEKRHRGVPHVLVDHSAVSIDGRIDNGEETLEQGVDLLGVQSRRQARIADNVAEHDRDRATVAFGLHGRFRVVVVDGASAAPAEAIGGVVRVAAVPAGESEAPPHRMRRICAPPGCRTGKLYSARLRVPFGSARPPRNKV